MRHRIILSFGEDEYLPILVAIGHNLKERNLFWCEHENIVEMGNLRVMHKKIREEIKPEFEEGVRENQHVPPGTQENYTSFSSRNPFTEKGNEPEFPEGAGGGKGYRGHETASTLRREAPLREPGVPPRENVSMDMILTFEGETLVRGYLYYADKEYNIVDVKAYASLMIGSKYSYDFVTGVRLEDGVILKLP